MFALAEHLGKTVAEIEAMTVDEWNHWHAYFSLKAEKEQGKFRKRFYN